MIKVHFHSLIEKLKKSSVVFDQKNRLILFFFLGFALIGFSKLPSQTSQAKGDSFKIDTIIPSGYVLIPIQLLNAQAISAVIGTHGVADIYSTSQGQKSKLLFSKAKIIKSPLNESTFSVLVKESKAHWLSQNANPFFAAVQNPKAKAIDNEPSKSTQAGITIIYQK